MTYSRPPGDECSSYRSELVEFALGTLTGRDRARMIEHLATCGACGDEVASWSDVGDALLVLTPAIEPPIGFEGRLLERHFGAPRTLRRRHAWRPRLGAALVASVLVVLGLVLGSDLSERTARTSPPLSARLTSQGRVLGQVFLTRGDPSWLSMSVDDRHWSGTAWCSVRLTNGRVEPLGRFSIVNGVGAWSAQIQAGAARVTSATISDHYGDVLATATWSS